MQRAQTEAVTFLGNQESTRSLYAIPGLDYVAHEDIIPYASAEKAPLHHELFDKFLAYEPDKGATIIYVVYSILIKIKLALELKLNHLSGKN